MGHIMNRFLSRLSCSLVTAYVITDNIMLIEGRGESMLPTLAAQGDILLAERISAKLHWISPGDIVTSLNPLDLTGNDNTGLICKRVLAIGGQKVPIEDNFVTRMIGKEFLSRFQRPIPPNTVWLEGDNTWNSTDSRHMGAVPLSLVQHRVICRLYPEFKLLVGQDSSRKL